MCTVSHRVKTNVILVCVLVVVREANTRWQVSIMVRQSLGVSLMFSSEAKTKN